MPAKRPKYHFLIARKSPSGGGILTLPGQTFGLKPVMAGITVKDLKGWTVIANARRKAKDGEVFFTTTLSQSTHTMVATNIFPLEGCDDILYQDVHEQYQQYLNDLKKQNV